MLTIPWNDDGTVVSSDDEPYDSDLIESDVEAELYSLIHHEQNDSEYLENSSQSPPRSNSQNMSLRSSSHMDIQLLSSTPNSLKNNSSDIQIIDPSNIQESKNRISFDKSVIFLGSSLEDFFQSDVPSGSNLYSSFGCPTNNSSRINSLKRQSDSDTHNLQSRKKLRKNKQNIHERVNESGSVVILSSSEDEDNDVIPIEPTNQQFQTNVSHERNCIDSDSSTSDSCFFKFTNKSFESTPSSSKTKDQWFVNDKDAYRSRRNSGRYHEHQTSICTICFQKGHTSKFCSATKGAKCYICGENHLASKCKSRVCSKCLQLGHQSKYCPNIFITCEKCNMHGHHFSECPDLWRSFHRMNEHSKKQKISAIYFQSTPVFCYNCGYPGHFGAVCGQYRMDANTFPTWPFALKYRNLSRHHLPKNKGSVDRTLKKKKKKKVAKTPDNGHLTNSPNTPNINNASIGEDKIKLKKKAVKTPDSCQLTNSPSTPSNSNTSIQKNRKLRRAEKNSRKRENRKLRLLGASNTTDTQQIETPSTPNISQPSPIKEKTNSSITDNVSVHKLSSKEKSKIFFKMLKEKKKLRRKKRMNALLQLKQKTEEN